MKTITIVTGNPYKFQIAQKVLEGKGLEKMIKFWAKVEDYWKKLADYLLKT